MRINKRNSMHAEHCFWLKTGVAGFIGGNFLEMLLKNGRWVIGLDILRLGTKPVWRKLEVLSGRSSREISG